MHEQRYVNLGRLYSPHLNFGTSTPTYGRLRSWVGRVAQHSAWWDEWQPWIHGSTWSLYAIAPVAISTLLPGVQWWLYWLCLVVRSLFFLTCHWFLLICKRRKICCSWAVSLINLSYFFSIVNCLFPSPSCTPSHIHAIIALCSNPQVRNSLEPWST